MREKRGILFGLPVRLLPDGGCEPINLYVGLILDLMVTTFGFNGAILEYERGEYWSALWQWLRGDFDD